jgi:hypothetical protein
MDQDLVSEYEDNPQPTKKELRRMQERAEREAEQREQEESGTN